MRPSKACQREFKVAVSPDSHIRSRFDAAHPGISEFVVQGTVNYFTLDLRDERWGAEPRHEFNGQTAAQMRDALAQVVRESQERAPVGSTFDTRVVLNGVRIHIEAKVDPGLYRSVAIDDRPA